MHLSSLLLYPQCSYTVRLVAALLVMGKSRLGFAVLRQLPVSSVLFVLGNGCQEGSAAMNTEVYNVRAVVGS